jgi:hypothetical protein
MDDRAKLLPVEADQSLVDAIDILRDRHSPLMTEYLKKTLHELLKGAEEIWPYRVHMTLIVTPMTPPLLPDGRLEVAGSHILDSFGTNPQNLMMVANMLASFAMQVQEQRAQEQGPQIILPPGVH